MELQTVRQVSETYGISAQMLRYYDQSGLLKSLRKEDYAYRVYDEENVRRLQQIIILRKLQIPVKQISVILDNPDAATALDIFKKNISEIQTEINALSTIKSALEIFVAKIEEIAAVRLNLNLLTDESVMKLAESLSLIQKNVKENKTMEELNRASETLDNFKKRLIKVVKLPPYTVAYIECDIAEYGTEKFIIDVVQGMMQKFVNDTNLSKIKPDFRHFEGDNGKLTKAWNIVTIPDDLEVPAPFIKKVFPGGLYAVYRNSIENKIGWRAMEEWVDESDKYEFASHQGYFQENFNIFNTYELAEPFLNYWDTFLPIREIKKIPEEERIAKLAAVQVAADAAAAAGTIHNIDLASLIPQSNTEHKFEGGLLNFTVSGDKSGMVTPRDFKCPVRISLRAMTDNQNLRLYYGNSFLIFNWEAKVNAKILPVKDIKGENVYKYYGCGRIPVSEFVDIEWTIGRDIMAVSVNGELRHAGTDYDYIRAFAEEPGYAPSFPVRVATVTGNNITVESLHVTEL